MSWTERMVICALCGGLATAALAHSGVTNPAVLSRMQAMTAIGDATKVIGQMAKGEAELDIAAARAAAAVISEKAAETPALFEPRETDPKSEAKPVIWETFGDFTAKSDKLEEVARLAATRIDGPDSLRGALGQIGAACESCHEVYRE